MSATTNPYFMHKDFYFMTISIVQFLVFATKAEIKVSADR